MGIFCYSVLPINLKLNAITIFLLFFIISRFLCTFSPTNLASEPAVTSSNSALSVAQPLTLVFKGESYEFWSIHMKTILKSQDLWDLVECGFADPDEGNKL